jgi:hypothetical protein
VDNPTCEWCGETLGSYYLTIHGERRLFQTVYVEADNYLLCVPCHKEASDA